ncbi:hypothetical protein HK097_011314 [Rhizophlyctis rosea]|uniref:Small ribosomal subunit protein bS18m n=1 Tax=Rhizophlyctis rosea TaxID=64517 RepID=A0AAD5X3T7_9FUNG|nr:hypothetical protein HK097_011314 [Rhizophlyctis rosea]
MSLLTTTSCPRQATKYLSTFNILLQQSTRTYKPLARSQPDRPSASISRTAGVQRYTEYQRKRDQRFGPGPSLFFKPGETYEPKDLNNENLESWRKKNKVDLVDVCVRDKINPYEKYKDGRWLSRFVTEMGYIKRRDQTGGCRETLGTVRGQRLMEENFHFAGLRAHNQRAVAKMIRRARAMGIMPYTSKLPDGA